MTIIMTKQVMITKLPLAATATLPLAAPSLQLEKEHDSMA